MGMVVQHNMTAMNANRNLGVTAGNLAKSTEKLSSGYKINRAGDNAAGLAISEKMRGQIRGLDQASTNAEDGISMIQTAEGALTETHSILQRMRELAVQASSDTNTDDDRTQIQNEIDQLTQEVDRIATTTEFNTKKLIDGSAKGAVSEKAGKANVDATFANSNVSAAITTDGSAKAAFTDVIRIEVTADFSEGKSTASTSKYTDTELKAAYTAIGGYNAASTYEAGREAAIATAKSDVESAQDNLNKNEKAVSTNDKELTKFVDALMAADVNARGQGNFAVLADGTTKEQVTAAVKKLKDAYVNAGQTGTETTAIATAKTELESLFSMKTGTLATGIAVPVIDTVDDEGADDKVTAVAASTTLADVTSKFQASLESAITKSADVEIAVADKEKDLADKQKALDLLEDDELAKAAYDYYKAEAEYNAGGATARQKEAATEAMNDASARIKDLNADKSVLNVTDLFGNTDDTKKFEIGSKVDDDNNLTITLKNKEGDDTVITISNADKMKAGDVITITAKEMVETEQAPTGKDAFRLQVGANAGQEVMLGINSMKAKDLNIVQTKDGVEGKALDVTNQASASLAVNAYDMAIQSVSTERAKLGATQNRLEHTISNLDTSSENLQSAESSLRDTDMAEEMTRYSKNNILMQAGQSMLAQANQSTQGVLSLLG